MSSNQANNPTSVDDEDSSPLRILCFGDSLTWGYWNSGCCQTPYSDRLAERLREVFPHREIRITTDGENGCLVSVGSFTDRLERTYRREPDGFDWAIVLGGTNDLGCGVNVDTIQKGLSRAWQCGFEHGARVVALTIPEIMSRALDRQRAQLNQWILSQAGDALYAFDLHAAMPFHSLSSTDRKKYWDDTVHPSGEGYTHMGDCIADALIEFIKNDN